MNIIELAKQAYLYSPSVAWTIEKSDTFVATHDGVHAFAALVEAAARADEREACAKVCEELPAPDEYSITDKSMWDITCMDCADAIRARGERA